MPLVPARLHERDPLRHHGVAGDERRTGRRMSGAHRVEDRPVVVPVHLQDLPAVRPPARQDVLGHDRGVVSRQLLAVPVEEGDQVRQPLAHREAPRLGELALLLLAVAHRAVDAAGEALEARREREAGGHGEPLPEVPGAPLDPRDVPLDVPLEGGASPAEPEERERDVEPAEAGQDRVGGRRRVAVAHHDPVAVRPEGVSRIEAAAPPEDQLEVDARNGAPRMPRRGERRHLEDVSARLPAEPGEGGELGFGEVRGLEIANDHSVILRGS